MTHSYANGFSDAEEKCLKSAKRLKCNFQKKEKFSYDPSWLSSHVGRHLFDAVRLASEGIRIIEKYNTNPITVITEGCGFGIDLGEIILEALKKDILEFSEKNKLSDCQKSCLALCVSANYIKYNGSSFHSVKKVALTGEGICGSYSSFAVELLTTLGIKAQTAYGVLNTNGKMAPHNWVSIELDNKSYYAEPKKSSCDLFEQEN